MADDDIMILAGEFPPVSQDDWLSAVEKVLAGRPFAKVLQKVTPDGLVVGPLYTLEDEADPAQYPGEGVSRRASTPGGSIDGWDVRQRHELGIGAEQANEAILADLRGGVTSIELITTGTDGGAELERALRGVLLDLAPVALRAPGDGVAEARALLHLAAAQGIPASSLTADLGCDPIGNLARHGGLPTPISDALTALAALGTETAATHTNVRVARADGSIFAEAGASPATELGATLATALTYLRSLTAAGLTPAQAMRQVLLVVSVGTDQFGDIAKLRALRVMWSRVADVLGVVGHQAGVQAVTSASVLTRSDPWVNMLRATVGCFAAATGGADIITVAPFDAQIGVSDQLGQRIARNTQLALMEESNLHRVIDPGGGSWYMESLTDQLADAAWGSFQQLEAQGGIIESLRSGRLQRHINGQWAERQAEVATRKRPITGVSEFPNLDEERLSRAPHPTAHTASEQRIEPLPVRHLAAGFEALRRAAATTATAPRVFLANLGPVAVHTARASWATNFFEAGGVRAIGNDGFDDNQAMVAAYAAAQTPIAVLCSSDSVYGERAESAAAALKAAGVQLLYLAGNPGEHRLAYEAAGVDDFVHVGVDVLAALEQAHTALGVDRTGGAA